MIDGTGSDFAETMPEKVNNHWGQWPESDSTSVCSKLVGVTAISGFLDTLTDTVRSLMEAVEITTEGNQSVSTLPAVRNALHV